MNDTYINYIDKLLDLAKKNNIFKLTRKVYEQ